MRSALLAGRKIDALAFTSLVARVGFPQESAIDSRHSETKLPRIAASTYLNSAPLVWSFWRGSRCRDVELIEAVPARCAEFLARRRVEAALVPVIEYQRIPGLAVVPDVCVGSRERVRSVVLVTRTPELKDVRRIALDETSRTSAALVKIIFREFLKSEPEWTSCAPDLKRMLSENDGALIIGDPAMTFSREEIRVWDMAGLWREHTGLGFVFAMWMSHEDAAAVAQGIDFRRAADEGLEAADEIIAFYEPLLGLPRSELVTYLHENISFHMDSEMRAGLELYFKLAYKHGLISAVHSLKSIDG